MALFSTSNCLGMGRQPEPTIVLVDDNDDFRRALAENLRDDGFRVVDRANPVDSALTAALEGADVVITDYEMENEDGLAFAARVHAEYPSLPIVVMTAYPTPQLEARIAATEYVLLLQKPLNYADLYKWLEWRGAQRPPARSCAGN